MPAPAHDASLLVTQLSRRVTLKPCLMNSKAEVSPMLPEPMSVMRGVMSESMGVAMMLGLNRLFGIIDRWSKVYVPW